MPLTRLSSPLFEVDFWCWLHFVSNFGPFLGHFWPILDHFVPFLANFGVFEHESGHVWVFHLFKAHFGVCTHFPPVHFQFATAAQRFHRLFWAIFGLFRCVWTHSGHSWVFCFFEAHLRFACTSPPVHISVCNCCTAFSIAVLGHFDISGVFDQNPLFPRSFWSCVQHWHD